MVSERLLRAELGVGSGFGSDGIVRSSGREDATRSIVKFYSPPPSRARRTLDAMMSATVERLECGLFGFERVTVTCLDDKPPGSLDVLRTARRHHRFLVDIASTVLDH